MCAFDDWTRRGFAGQIRRSEGCTVVYWFHFSPGGFACKSGPCRVSEVCQPELWVTPQVPKPAPKRCRTITQASAVAPLSIRCHPALSRGVERPPVTVHRTTQSRSARHLSHGI